MDDDRQDDKSVQTDLRPLIEAVKLAARAGSGRLRPYIRPVIFAASVGAMAVGGFDWLWRGEWGGGINPLTWNSDARSGFFEGMLLGAAVGGMIGGAAAFVRRPRHAQVGPSEKPGQ